MDADINPEKDFDLPKDAALFPEEEEQLQQTIGEKLLNTTFINGGAFYVCTPFTESSPFAASFFLT